MNLRERKFPPKFWLTLHTYTFDPHTLLIKPKSRPPSSKQLTHGLDTLRSHLQSLIYFGSINRRKGDLRTGKFPLTVEQFSVMKKLGASHQYKNVSELENVLNLEHPFEYKGYVRAISDLQFRLQNINLRCSRTKLSCFSVFDSIKSHPLWFDLILLLFIVTFLDVRIK